MQWSLLTHPVVAGSPLLVPVLFGSVNLEIETSSHPDISTGHLECTVPDAGHTRTYLVLDYY
jgi:hypothetical protein